MKNKYRVVVVDDHAIVRQGLCALLSLSKNAEVVGEADNGIGAIRLIEKIQPELVFIDLSLPKKSGLDVIKEIKSNNAAIKMIALTVYKNEEYVFAALQAGADGYASKDATFDELEIAINSVMRGKSYLAPDISATVIEGYLSGEKLEHNKYKSKWDMVTKREREILILIAEGNKNKEIAENLYISVKTVEKHRANLMRKLNIRNATALAAYAMDRGLV